MLKKLSAYIAMAFAFCLAATQNAYAALDTDVATELAAAKTDILEIGAIVFGIAVAIVLYKWFKRAL
ncbi:MAG: major capsid protein [Polaromonas sp.]|nr:major capsid protein [Polaromonas sp.]